MTYVVDEEDENGDGSVLEVCLQVSGDLDRDVDVYVTTSSQTALGERLLVLFSISCLLVIYLCLYCSSAGEDYSNILAQLIEIKLRFQRSVGVIDQGCVNVSLLSDDVLENDEVFLVQLSTKDSSVNLNPQQAEVTITNNDSMCLVHF